MLSPNCPWAFVAELAALQRPGLPQVFQEEIDSQLQWGGVQIIWCSWPLPPMSFRFTIPFSKKQPKTRPKRHGLSGMASWSHFFDSFFSHFTVPTVPTLRNKPPPESFGRPGSEASGSRDIRNQQGRVGLKKGVGFCPPILAN